MNIKPLVTIAIPTFNRASYLFKSIHSALNQTYSNIEVFISDNASTDETSSIVELFTDHRLKYHRHDINLGQILNWNHCLNNAQGEYFIMLSDDDILEENAIEVFINEFNDRNISLVYSKVKYIDEYDNFTGVSRPSPVYESGLNFIVKSFEMSREIFPSATMHRTDIARQLGGYPNIGTTTDLALRLSLAVSGAVRHISLPLVRYRVHQQSLSFSLESIISSFDQLYNWFELPKNQQLLCYIKYIAAYKNNYIYSLGRSQLLQGSNPQTLSFLSQLALGRTQKFILFLLKFRIVRFIFMTVRHLKRTYVVFKNKTTV